MVVVALQAKGKTGSFQYMGLEPLGSMWRKMKLLSPPTLHYASGLMIYIYMLLNETIPYYTSPKKSLKNFRCLRN